MATVCSHCGKDLPRGDSRFCTNCGTLVPDYPLNPPNRMATQNANTPTNTNSATTKNNDAQGHQNAGMREQVAQQPAVRPAQSDSSNVTPWLGLEGQNATPWLGIQGYDVIPQTPLPQAEVRTQREQSAQATWPTDRPASMTPPHLPSTPQPARDLHARVWDEDRQDIDELPTQAFSSNGVRTSDWPEQEIDSLPTSALSSIGSGQQVKDEPRQQKAQSPVEQSVSNIDELPTAQFQIADVEKKSPTPNPASWPGNVAQTPQPMRQPNPASWPGNVAQPASQPNPVSWSGNAAALASGQDSHAQGVPTPVSTSRPRSKKPPLLFAIVGVLVICVLAIGAWMMLAQPFAVSSVTDPLQAVSNNTLGVKLTYPSSWHSNHEATSLSLADSSNTGQIKLTMSDATSTDLAKYLQQQATKVQMTNAKVGAAQMFAGSTWQQIQGNVQVLGANYVETIAVTIHNNHLYTWSQMAPKVSYADEESLIFAPARSSLKFN
ncbi:zinc ribbon domain-containing protein [Dictyobacter arantiisoli]|uniref:Uncharacterized protein n=1 Tax=Dictyobacter arantiisoli TaxID=2014874 RepID=A0A5A5TCF1_9CHLR|nr:zinc ribbon domain-containing protein [Dictyobacter arantiisoli]GCF08826.1 hypothetical protein KDI_23900 [Dictyobacter arantiisoli]